MFHSRAHVWIGLVVAALSFGVVEAPSTPIDMPRRPPRVTPAWSDATIAHVANLTREDPKATPPAPRQQRFDLCINDVSDLVQVADIQNACTCIHTSDDGPQLVEIMCNCSCRACCPS